MIALSQSQPFSVDKYWTKTGTDDCAISKSAVLSGKYWAKTGTEDCAQRYKTKKK